MLSYYKVIILKRTGPWKEASFVELAQLERRQLWFRRRLKWAWPWQHYQFATRDSRRVVERFLASFRLHCSSALRWSRDTNSRSVSYSSLSLSLSLFSITQLSLIIITIIWVVLELLFFELKWSRILFPNFSFYLYICYFIYITIII